MATSVQNPPPGVNVQSEKILPTLFGEGYGTYAVKRNNFILSFLLHTLGVFAILYATHFIVQNKEVIARNVITLIEPDDITLPASAKSSGGGGGGGARDKIEASKGKPPKQDMNQITPPTVLVQNDPKLAVQQSIEVPPQIKLPTGPDIGNPLSQVLIASNGVGSGSGIGNGHGGGIGSGDGRGYGPGYGAGTGGGVFRIGGGVSAPKILFQPDPEYSEEARKAKYQGVVTLYVEVGPDGRPRNIRVQRSLGMGLDEKAIEAVQKWRFEPAKKDGQNVTVAVNIEVSFHLY
jgi:protein TonB